jgi:4-amino-4-deoxy-L-arabinose transferase-like glycosyltransferase
MKSKLFPLAVILSVALFVRLGFLVLFGGIDQSIYDSMSDQTIYLDLAANMVTGKGFVMSTAIWIAVPGQSTSIMPPLYPIFLAGIFSVFGQNIIVVRLIQILLSLVVVVAGYVLGYGLFGRSVGILSGVLLAVYPASVMYVRPLMSEALFYPLVMLLALLTWRLWVGQARIVTYVLWGVVAGLAILTRTEAALLAALLAVSLIARALFQRQRIAWSRYGLAIVALLVVLMPYAAYNYQAHGHVSFFPNARWKLWDRTWWNEMRTRPEWQGVLLPERRVVPDWNQRSEVSRDGYLWSLAMQFIRENPLTVILQRIRQLPAAYPLIPRELIRDQLVLPDGHAYGPTSLDDVVRYATPAEQIRVWAFRLMFVLGLFGLILMIKHRRSDAYWLVLFLVWNVAHTMAFVGSERLRLQIDPIVAVLASSFIVYASGAVFQSSPKPILPSVPPIETGATRQPSD